MKAALCEALADLESYCPREFSLMLIEAVKVVRSEFESRRNMALAIPEPRVPNQNWVEESSFPTLCKQVDA